MPTGPLTVAVAQPQCVLGDVRGNAQRHAAMVRAASARVIVFPELSLTGYEMGAPTVDPAAVELRPLVEACAATNSVALAGAPVAEADRRFIATLAITGDGVEVAYRKMWLGGSETASFDPGPAAVAYVVDGWRLGLAICKDTRIRTHTRRLEEVGINAYVAGLVMHAYETDVQTERAVAIARRLNVPVAFAGFAGPTGSGYRATAGASGVWAADGAQLAGAGAATGEIARATLETVVGVHPR